ncbi:MAG: hypothetical protein AAFV01_15725, partial [Bacteroidota bacterium]
VLVSGVSEATQVQLCENDVIPIDVTGLPEAVAPGFDAAAAALFNDTLSLLQLSAWGLALFDKVLYLGTGPATAADAFGSLEVLLLADPRPFTQLLEGAPLSAAAYDCDPANNLYIGMRQEILLLVPEFDFAFDQQTALVAGATGVLPALLQKVLTADFEPETSDVRDVLEAFFCPYLSAAPASERYSVCQQPQVLNQPFQFTRSDYAPFQVGRRSRCCVRGALAHDKGHAEAAASIRRIAKWRLHVRPSRRWCRRRRTRTSCRSRPCGARWCRSCATPRPASPPAATAWRASTKRSAPSASSSSCATASTPPRSTPAPAWRRPASSSTRRRPSPTAPTPACVFVASSPSARRPTDRPTAQVLTLVEVCQNNLRLGLNMVVALDASNSVGTADWAVQLAAAREVVVGVEANTAGTFHLAWGRFGSFRERRDVDPASLPLPEREPQVLAPLTDAFDLDAFNPTATPFLNFGATNGLDALALCATQLPKPAGATDEPPNLCMVVTDGAFLESES